MNAQAAVRWHAPGLSHSAMATPAIAMPSVEELQAIEAAAHAEGFARGHAEGLVAGQGEMRRLVAQVEGILDSFSRPLARLDTDVADALGDLAVRIAGSLIGHAYTCDPNLMADLVREALDAVGSTSRDVELRLHPDDLGALTPALMGLDGVRLIADTTLARGELRVHSESVRIDGTLASRLQSTLESIVASTGVP